MGVPSKRSPAMLNEICERISNGESLREICKADGMPDKATVMRWLGSDENFRDQYARAREAQADHFAEEILDIADNATNDWMKRQVGDDVVEVPDHEHISRSKLRVDARKWLMAKMAPKKYGDRLEVGGEVVHEFVARVPEKAESAEEWARQYAPSRLLSGKPNEDPKPH